MNNITIFIFLFTVTLIYYVFKQKYELALISFLLLLSISLFNNNKEHLTETLQLSPANNETLTNFLNGDLIVDYLTVNNDANICGVKMSNGSINCPNVATFYTLNGPIAFTNGSIYAGNIFIQ